MPGGRHVSGAGDSLASIINREQELADVGRGCFLCFEIHSYGHVNSKSKLSSQRDPVCVAD